MYKAVLIQGHLASSGVAFESPLKKNVQSQTRMFLSITGTPDASPSPINHDIPIKQCIQYIYIYIPSLLPSPILQVPQVSLFRSASSNIGKHVQNHSPFPPSSPICRRSNRTFVPLAPDEKRVRSRPHDIATSMSHFMPRNFAETFHDPIPWNIRNMDTNRWLLGMCKGHLWSSFECFWHLEDLEICCGKKEKTTVFREFLDKLWYAKYNYTVGASKKSCLRIECILYSCLVLSNVLCLVDIPFLNGCEVVDSLSQVTCTTPSTWRCLKPVCLFTIPAVLRGDKKHGCLNTGVNTPYNPV